MTPGKCTVVKLNLFHHRQPNSRDQGIFKPPVALEEVRPRLGL